jgi:hypothetical protein
MSAHKLWSRRTLYRWAPWVGGAVLVVGVAAFLGVYFTNTADDSEPETQLRGPAIVDKPLGKRVKVAKEVQQVASEFIKSAVTGRDLERGWRLAHPELRAGFTHREWVRGVLPFSVFPVDLEKAPPFSIDDSFERQVDLQVVLSPRKGASGFKPQIFFIGLKAVGNGGSKRWRVYYWQARSNPALPQTGE